MRLDLLYRQPLADIRDQDLGDQILAVCRDGDGARDAVVDFLDPLEHLGKLVAAARAAGAVADPLERVLAEEHHEEHDGGRPHVCGAAVVGAGVGDDLGGGVALEKEVGEGKRGEEKREDEFFF